MKTVLKGLSVWITKKQLKATYQEYLNRTEEIDCGHQMACYLSASTNKLRIRYNSLLKKLERLGEPIKKDWYILGAEDMIVSGGCQE